MLDEGRRMQATVDFTGVGRKPPGAELQRDASILRQKLCGFKPAIQVMMQYGKGCEPYARFTVAQNATSARLAQIPSTRSGQALRCAKEACSG
jgi:hypothetical protein